MLTLACLACLVAALMGVELAPDPKPYRRRRF